MATILFVTAETVRIVAILASPFMPAAMTRMLDLLAVPAEDRTIAAIDEQPALVPGASLPPPAPVFPRYVEPEPEAAR
jgi:methionyl-tRNA synthetase (EC 6.1.1.10)